MTHLLKIACFLLLSANIGGKPVPKKTSKEEEDKIFGAENDKYNPKNKAEKQKEWKSEQSKIKFEGDMMLTGTMKKLIQSSGAEVRDVLPEESKRWTGKQVPYVIDSSLDTEMENIINAAIADFHTYTCVKFVKRNSESDYIKFNHGAGCWSWLGKIGGEQELSLGSDCKFKGVVMHEMMHALGFFHEHTRPDRDEYVTINFGNIENGMQSNFQKYSHGEMETYEAGYDYSSLMHYPENAFSIDENKPTIVLKKSFNGELGQRDGFSIVDIQQIQKLFHCPSDVPPTTGPPTTAVTTTGPPGFTTTQLGTTLSPPEPTSETTRAATTTGPTMPSSTRPMTIATTKGSPIGAAGIGGATTASPTVARPQENGPCPQPCQSPCPSHCVYQTSQLKVNQPVLLPGPLQMQAPPLPPPPPPPQQQQQQQQQPCLGNQQKMKNTLCIQGLLPRPPQPPPPQQQQQQQQQQPCLGNQQNTKNTPCIQGLLPRPPQSPPQSPPAQQQQQQQPCLGNQQNTKNTPCIQVQLGFPKWPSDFHWASDGIPWNCDCDCIPVNEPSDPDGWNDNFLCYRSKVPVKKPLIKWSHKGPIKDMRCIQVNEPSDPDSWNDNFLCTPRESPYNFMWSSNGPINKAGVKCIKIDDPNETNEWRDNFLCARTNP